MTLRAFEVLIIGKGGYIHEKAKKYNRYNSYTYSDVYNFRLL